MTRRFGIDTSILVRLLTGEPREDFLDCVAGLIALVEHEGSEIFASNQVIGEAYVAVQHHYRVSKPDARAGLLDVLRSGLVSPMGGPAVFAALEASGGAGLFDRLIGRLRACRTGGSDFGSQDGGPGRRAVPVIRRRLLGWRVEVGERRASCRFAALSRARLLGLHSIMNPARRSPGTRSRGTPNPS